MTLSSLISRVEEGFELASASVRPEPSSVSTLVDRLRNHVRDRGGMSRDAETGEIVLPNGAWAMMLAAADEIEQLKAALRPFASLADAYFYRYETRPGEFRESHENDPDDRAVYGINRVEITTGDFRRARKVLENRKAGLADAHKKDFP